MNYINFFPYSTFFYLMILFLVTVFAFLADILNNKKQRKILVVLVILFLSIPAGIRHWEVGLDTKTYMLAIESASKTYSGESFISYYESGFQVIIKLLVVILNEPKYVLLCISLLTNGLIISTLWVYREKISFTLSVFCYFSMYYFETYNIMRQWLAIAIVFFAFKYLIKSKYIIFIILTVIAGSIHSTAFICFVFIPIHILIAKKISLKYKVLTSLSVIIILVFSNKILSFIGLESTIQKYQSYYINGNTSSSVNFGLFFLVRLSVLLFAIILYKIKDYKFDDNVFQKQVISICLLGTILSMLGYFYDYIGRIGAYASAQDIVLFAMISKTKMYSIIIKVIIILLMLTLLYMTLSNSSQGQMPYKIFE